VVVVAAADRHTPNRPLNTFICIEAGKITLEMVPLPSSGASEETKRKKGHSERL
jgi:hypothetical protein